MKAQSNHHPGDFTLGKDKSFINYDIRQVEISNEMETRQAYEYDYVEVKGQPTKAKFLEALEKEDKEKDDIPWIPDETVLGYKAEKVEELKQT